MASPERCLQILAGVRKEADRFLDPLPFTDGLSPAKRALSPVRLESPAKRESPARVSDSEARLGQLTLRSELSDVRTELREAKEDAQQHRRRAENQKGREAASVARLEQRCEHLELERRKALARAAEAERALLQAETRQSELVSEKSELQETGKWREEELQRRGDDALKRLEEASAASTTAKGSDLTESEAPAAKERGATQAGLEREREALRSRVAELESEVKSLQVLLKEGAPDREISALLQKQLEANEEELKGAQQVRRELVEAKEQIFKLEQEGAGLKAGMEARNVVLQEAEKALHAAGLAKRDAEAFAVAAEAIVRESRKTYFDDAGESAKETTAPASPLELSLSWARLQTELTTLRRQRADAQHKADSSNLQERSTALELGKVRNEFAAAKASLEEVQLDLRREKTETTAQKARAQVLREAVTKVVGGQAEASATASMAAGADAEMLKAQLEAVREQVRQQGLLLQSRQQEIEKANKQHECSQADKAHVADLEMKAEQLERLNRELWTSNRDLEQQQERLVAEVEQRDAQLDQATTKVLHLKHGPAGRPATGSLEAEEGHSEQVKALEALEADNAALQEQLGRKATDRHYHPEGAMPGDLERRQAERQLDRFKKATRKYVQEFREGIFGILGWKVEMRGEGSAMRWHLTSRLHDEELAFQLRPAEPGKQAEFDLLSTPWAERLQTDREAMAYLEVYGSIPGFLAAVTTELLAQKAL